MVSKSNSTLVRGSDLRRLRKHAFNSAEAFAAACESVSVPTIYRAERGGPILKTYLNRMARELGVDVERLIVPYDEKGEAQRVDLTGDWFGLILATDRFGHPYVIGEDTRLEQTGSKVEGRSVHRAGNETMIDFFEYSTFKDNVFCGQLRSEKWPFPLECAAFVLSGSRDITWLDGYISWFDLDSEQPQFSKYILIRRDAPNFEADVKNAHRIMDDENKLLRTRRFLESGYSFGTSLSLVTASEAPDEENTSHDVPDFAAQLSKVTLATASEYPVVAMAPLTVLNEERSYAFFADGLIDDIATELVRTSQIEVLPRSVFGRDEPVTSERAAERGATHVLGGTMRRSEGRLRVNTQLVDTATGRIVWAERYDHAAEVTFAMHDAIAHDVVRTLRHELTNITVPTANDTSNPRAYELFLKGRSLYLRGMYTHSLRAAEALLVRAVEIDPNFARAHAQLSICRSYLAQSIHRIGSKPATTEGLADAQNALSIDPELPLGNAALGLAHYALGEYSIAEKSFLVAINQDPSLFEPQFFLARNHRLQGDRESAAKRFAMAASLRPDDFRSSGLLAEEQKALGRTLEAEATFRTALSLVEKELEDNPDNAGALAFGAAVLAHLEMMDRAQVWAEWALAIAPDDCLVHYNTARMHAIDGALKAALYHLERAFVVPAIVRRRLALWMRYDEDLEALADDATFQRLQQAATECYSGS